MPGAYPRRNFEVALTTAEAVLGDLDPARVGEVAASTVLSGRMELVEGDPALLMDAAHNPDGAGALAEALADAVGERPVVGCLACLADKDAAGMVAALAPRLAGLVCTEIPPGSLVGSGRPQTDVIRAAELAGLARAAGLSNVEEVTDPPAAIQRTLDLAAGLGGVALVTGSHYLLAYATGIR
jgi:dihydrofolate synthase / folylpolyglutamate synthase